MAEQRFRESAPHNPEFASVTFAIGVIHLQMMKIEGHREFVAAKRGMLAVFQRGKPTVIRLRGVKRHGSFRVKRPCARGPSV